MTASPTTIAQLVEAKAARTGNAPILNFVRTDKGADLSVETRDFSQLWANAAQVAGALAEMGCRRGDRVAIILPNAPEFVETMIAVAAIGAVFVPIDPRIDDSRLLYMLTHTGTRVAVVEAGLAARSASNTDLSAQLDHVIVVEAGGVTQTGHGETFNVYSYNALDDVAPPVPTSVDATPDEAMQLMFTSGTTGLPKAILSPHARFMGIGAVLPAFGFTAADRPYTGLSLTHANAQLITLGAALHLDLPATISRVFTKSRLWNILARFECTMFNLLGGMTTAIYAEPASDGDRDHAVRRVISAGMPKAIWRDFEDRFGVEVFEFYGAAEGGLLVNPPGAGPVGSIGKPPPNLEAAILDGNGQLVAAGIRGEICFRNADGSAPEVAYYDNPKATASKTRGGWLHMGDIGHTDEEGWFYFDYRDGGGIRINGEFVNPAVVEKALAEHPQVDDVFVYGRSTPAHAPGEKDVVAAIVTSGGASIRPEDLMAYCAGVLKGAHVPRILQIVDAIPKTASQKPIERELLAELDRHPDTLFFRH